MMKSGESLEWVVDTVINETNQKEDDYERKVLPRMYSTRSFTPTKVKIFPTIPSSLKPWRKLLTLTSKRRSDTRILGLNSPFGRYKNTLV